MSYKQKYKINYLEFNNSTDFIKHTNMTGGNITWATPEYIQQIISSKNPDLSKCDLIKHVVPKTNEGRHNDGIGFVTIEDKEYFLKYGVNLFDEFKTGYMLSKLRHKYPYFLNVHSLFKCNYIPRGTTHTIDGQVMVVDKGGETIYQYLNRKSKEYIFNLIPDLETKVSQLDDTICSIINQYLNDDDKILSEWTLKEKYPDKYHTVIYKISECIQLFYSAFTKEIIQFQNEFVPLFIQNYKSLIDSYILVDIITLNYYNNYISDKKCDNFMVITEPYVLDKTHINIQVGAKNIRINNICKWHNSMEYCFIYPVDFGSVGNMNYPTLPPQLASHFLNQWIYKYSQLHLYSDIHENNIATGNILSLTQNKIQFKFSKFSAHNNITKLDISTLFDKYNPFFIKIFNPLTFFFEGLISNYNTSRRSDELDALLQQFPLDANDYRFQTITPKHFNINKLDDAVDIIQIFSSGHTVVYDEHSHQYRSYSNSIDFYTVNGLIKNSTPFNHTSVYKNFDLTI